MAAATPIVAQGQQVWRIVGPDGRVTFSDKPPQEPNAKAAPAASGGSGGSGTAGLPFELRQVAGKYPVTLYTGTNCVPCGSGRAMLTSRGIPFTEKTVTTAEDAQALERLAGESSLPLLTIGGQQLKGYSDSEWTQFLDAAGYPKNSVLPASYRPPAATPLVAVQRPAAPTTAAPASNTANQRATVPAPSSGSSPSNPAGIQF
nr:glutaredoxin family protein [Ramlibacter tataouinensis]